MLNKLQRKAKIESLKIKWWCFFCCESSPIPQSRGDNERHLDPRDHPCSLEEVVKRLECLDEEYLKNFKKDP